MPKHRPRIHLGMLQSVLVSGAALLIASTAVLAVQQVADKGTSSYPARADSRTAEADTSHLGAERTLLFPEQDPEFSLDEAQLERHGAYRLIPAGFVGQLEFDLLPLKWNAGNQSTDVRELERSPLYQEVPSIPSDLNRIVFDSHDATSGVVLRQVFKSDDGQRSIEVTRRAVVRSPIDVAVPGVDASLALSKETVEGVPAIVYRRTANSPNPNSLIFIQANDGEIETIVVVRGLPESLAFSILNELI